MSENGRVHYGPREADTLPPEWAEAVLRLLYERHRGTFGALLAEVVTGKRFTAARERKATANIAERERR